MWRHKCLVLLGAVLSACAMSADEGQTPARAEALFGSGPYPAAIETDASLPHQTIYRPVNLAALGTAKLGVLLWGNGGCVDNGASAWPYLAEIASHGYLVIAAGDPLTGPIARADARAPGYMTTDASHMRQALDWALAENLRAEGRYEGRLDPDQVAVAGTSCGTMLAIQTAADPRVKAIMLHHGGIMPNRPERPTLVVDQSLLDRVRLPFLYVIGESNEVAGAPSRSDFAYIDHQSVFLANLNTVGHGGTLNEPNGGAEARVALDWLAWRLRGDANAARTFIGADCRLCVDPNWTVRRKGVDYAER